MFSLPNKLVLVPTVTPAVGQIGDEGSVRRYKLARVAIDGSDDRGRFSHLKRVYD